MHFQAWEAHLPDSSNLHWEEVQIPHLTSGFDKEGASHSA